jgi:hypothetical protein
MDIITLFLAEEGHRETGGNGGLRAKREKFAPETWDGLRPRWTERERRLKSRCGGLLEGCEGVQFMHQTAKEFMSREYIWNAIFPRSNGFVSTAAKNLAILSGLIRRLKCCREVTLEAQRIQREESRGGPKQHDSDAPNPHVADYRLLHNALLVAGHTALDHLEGEDYDDFEQLVDELDATGSYHALPQGTEITYPPRRDWEKIFFGRSGWLGALLDKVRKERPARTETDHYIGDHGPTSSPSIHCPQTQGERNSSAAAPNIASGRFRTVSPVLEGDRGR